MKIFINYKRNIDPDHALARHLHQTLSANGHTVFRDETGIYSGGKWAEIIYNEIDKCEVVISLVSNVSLQSRWVLNEVDRALKLGKVVIPVLLEKLIDSLDFQEYNPRFRTVQHYTFTGSFEQAAGELLERLQNNPAVYESQWFAQTTHSFDAQDDSENRGWPSFRDSHPQRYANGTLRLSVADAVRLAMLRSSYYQRHLKKEEAEPELPLDDAAFQAYRRSFYTHVAIGDFGITGFTRPDTAGQEIGVGGYFELVAKHQRVLWLEQALASLNEYLQVLEAKFEVGRITRIDVDQHRQQMAAKQRDLQQACDELEDALDDYRVYTLGLPGDVAIVVDDPVLRRFQANDREMTELGDALRTLTFEILNKRAAEPPQPISNEPARIAAFQRQVEAQVQNVKKELAALAARSAAGSERMNALNELKQELETIHRGLGEPFKENEYSYYRDAIDKSYAPLDHQASMALQTVGSLTICRARIRLADLMVEAVALELPQAEAAAAQYRPDREMLATHPGLKRIVRQTLRSTLRDLQRGSKNFEHARQAAALALNLMNLAHMRYAAGAEDSGPLVRHTVEFADAQIALCQAWFVFQAARLRLGRDTGAMKMNDAGLWVDEVFAAG
ncbi:MAG TPA: TIR domain-containing protein [Gemmataceae bacterium]|jgi:hypothetical protein|nr:TIR domain-containing protein [Gemmataceae bacterium]